MRGSDMFHGSMVALVTPMQADGSLDWEALARLVEFHIDQGSDAIVTMGTTGESATLDEQQHCEVIRRVVDQVAGRTAVIAGTGANSTTEAISLTRCAMQAGVDACLLVTPYYNKPGQEGLYLHHKAIAEAVAVPQILYNVPGRTACDMLPETVERLSLVPNIIGIKEATGDMERAKDILARCGESMELYSGDDATAVDWILAGARGGISVTANIAPAEVHKAYAAALAGDAQLAHEIDQGISALHEVLFLEANPIPVKWALHEMGLIEPGIRLPLTPLAEAHRPPLRKAMQSAGIVLK